MAERRGGSKEEKRKRKQREKRECVFAYEIKWRIYTKRSPVRPIVNYTVNRGVLFDRRGKEDRAVLDEDEIRRPDRGERGGGEGREGEREEMQRRSSLWSARDDLRDDS